MFSKILLPLDGSQIAEKAVPYGEEFVKKLGSELVLLHVCGPEHRQLENMHRAYLEKWAETITEKVKKGPGGKAIKITVRIESGEPSDNICSIVAQNDFDLIIMTQAGTSGLKTSMLGSVVEHVCRTVPIPVLLVRPQYDHYVIGKKRLISRILLPLDGSELSQLALPVAQELASRLNARITLFQMASRAYPYASADTRGGISVVSNTQLNDYEVIARRQELIMVENKLKAQGIKATHYVISGTDAANEIIETGSKTNADIIIMSTHGRSGISRWVFGSTAEKVLHHGDLPLLLINARAN